MRRKKRRNVRVGKLSSHTYKNIKKPSNIQEAEGVCPLCNTVMRRSKSASFNGHFYSFDFPVYFCINHYHGHFRWLGGARGYVRILFPQISQYGKVICDSKQDECTELMTIKCPDPDCGFEWEELKIPSRNEAYCPECSMRIKLQQ